MRVMALPDKMGTKGVKARVTGTDALPETRSSEAMPKEERVRLKQRSIPQSFRAETLATETGVSRLVPEVPSPTCTKHPVSDKEHLLAQTHNPLASKQAQLLGHSDSNPNTRPPHCLEQRKNDTVNHA